MSKLIGKIYLEPKGRHAESLDGVDVDITNLTDERVTIKLIKLEKRGRKKKEANDGALKQE